MTLRDLSDPIPLPVKQAQHCETRELFLFKCYPSSQRLCVEGHVSPSGLRSTEGLQFRGVIVFAGCTEHADKGDHDLATLGREGEALVLIWSSICTKAIMLW